MKIVRYLYQGKIAYGILEGDAIAQIEAPAKEWQLEKMRQTGESVKLDAVKLLAPCVPSKVICIGLNYRSHAEEMGQTLPEEPITFMKPSTAVIGPEEVVLYPGISRRVDYEAELAVIIGRSARMVKEEEALKYVLGYSCANDVTARDLQPAAGQWTYAKGFDTFCPLGPVIETGIKDPENLKIEGFLNGQVVQSSSTNDHIFTVARLIAYITACMTLLPGDVIITGTPSGIGPMEPGDRFEVVIDRIGRLSNTCQQG